jgi:hypothetical protein
MKTNRSLALAAGLAVVALAWGSAPAQAQGFSFGLAVPGVSVGVNTGGPGYYGGGYYGGYAAVVPAPVVVAPYAGVVVPRPVYGGVGYYGPRPYYGPGYHGGYYGGGYRHHGRYWR